MDLTAMLDAACEGTDWTREGNEVCIPLRGDRVQRIYAELFQAGDLGERVRMFTEIGDENRLSEGRLRAALAVNFGLPLGKLAIHDGTLVMSETLSAQCVDPTQIRAALIHLAEAADRYEQHLYGTDDH